MFYSLGAWRDKVGSEISETHLLVRRKSLLAHGRWSHSNLATPEHRKRTKRHLGGNSAMVWGGVAYYCKIDLINKPGNLNAQGYQDSVLDFAGVTAFI